MPPRNIARLLAALLLPPLALTQVPAAHAGNDDEDAAIEASIQDGIALRRAGNDEGALTLFLELERQNPNSVRILLHVTAAAQATGRWLLAYGYLRKASAFKNDPYYVRNRAAVKSVEEAVARHVTQLRVVGQPAGAEVRLSGNLLGTLPFKEPVAVELGSYVLEVHSPGFYSLRRDLALSTGGTLNQEVVALAAKKEPSPSLPTRRGLAPAEGSTPPARDRAVSWWESRNVTWSLAGIALAGAATSGVALALRERSVTRWNDDARCIDRQDVTLSRGDVCSDERERANTAGSVALTGGVVAAVFATATLTHWLTTSSKPAQEAQRRPQAACGIGLGNVACSGSF